VASNATTRFRIRWGLGVEETDRVSYDGKDFEIIGVKEIGRREGQEITAAARD
jgi:head-tail adaptor